MSREPGSFFAAKKEPGSFLVAALVPDLIFASRITSTAAALGVPVQVLRTTAQLAQRLASAGDALVLLDFDADDIDPAEAITLCRQAATRPRVVAFGSHVRSDLIEACRRAGADEVLPRSAFVRRLPDLLRAVIQSEEPTREPGR